MDLMPLVFRVTFQKRLNQRMRHIPRLAFSKLPWLLHRDAQRWLSEDDREEKTSRQDVGWNTSRCSWSTWWKGRATWQMTPERDGGELSRGREMTSEEQKKPAAGLEGRDGKARQLSRHFAARMCPICPRPADAYVYARHCKITASKTITLQPNSSRNPTTEQWR